MNSFDKDSSQKEYDLHFHYIYRDYPRLHNHDYWEFFIVFNGSYKHTINEKKIIMGKNSAYMIRPNDLHCLCNDSENSSHLNILIRSALFKEACNALSADLYDRLMSGEELPVFLNDAQTKRIFDYTSLLQDCKTRNLDYALTSKLLIFYILEKVVNQNNYIDENKPKWLADLLLQINSPYNLHWKIEDVLASINYSHSYFARQFKLHMNCTPIQYLTQTKMIKACDFLLHSNMTILDIAFTLGYSSLSHFNHTFKSFFNVPPTYYRKTHQSVRKK